MIGMGTGIGDGLPQRPAAGAGEAGPPTMAPAAPEPLTRLHAGTNPDVTAIQTLRPTFRDGNALGWKDFIDQLAAQDGVHALTCSGNRGGTTIYYRGRADQGDYCVKSVPITGGCQPLAGISFAQECAGANAGPHILGTSVYCHSVTGENRVLVVFENLRKAPPGISGMQMFGMGTSHVADALDFLEGHTRDLHAIVDRVEALFDGTATSHGHPDPHLHNAVLRVGYLVDAKEVPPGWFRVEGTNVAWRVDMIDPFSFTPREKPVVRGADEENSPYSRELHRAQLLRNFGLT